MRPAPDQILPVAEHGSIAAFCPDRAAGRARDAARTLVPKSPNCFHMATKSGKLEFN